ncbi:MAG: MFS transporter [Methylobacterium sp.]|nr:MAG: MFS transporter [Methylobacterium sp.]
MEARVASPPPAGPSPGAFAPFGFPAFTLLWTATLLSNTGTWMHDVAAGWLMTSLSPSPLVVSLVQASTSAAMALFALPAGALADLFDRKRLLITLNILRMVLAVLLGVLTFAGLVTPWILLAVTFLLGICSALIAPAWQAIVPSLVPRETLPQAVALNAMGINVARAIGPAVGGVLIVSFGVAIVFVINGLSELIVVAALLLWKAPPRPARGQPERFLPAIGAGLRFAAASSRLRIVLIRATAFFVFAAAYWSLLPVLVRNVMGGGAAEFGILVSAVGAGAVSAAIVLPYLSRHLGGADGLVRAGSIGTALALGGFALAPSLPVAAAAAFGAGIAWILTLSSFNVAAQSALPDWVRGRGLSIYGLVFYAAMTAGALLWGSLATYLGVATTLMIAAAGMLLGMLATRRKVLSAEPQDLAPAASWPEPVVVLPVEGDRGPVLVTIEYRIRAEDRDAFLQAIRDLAGERRRDGAYAWSVWEDIADPGRFVETFEEASWNEHLRHHARVTRADADLHAGVQRLHVGPEPPRVTHLLKGAP